MLDLRHLQGSPYVSIVQTELDELEAAINRLQICVSKGTFKGQLESQMQKAVERFESATSGPTFDPDDKDLAISKTHLINLRKRLANLNTQVVRDLESCGYHAGTETIFQDDAGTGEPSNQRGGRLAEIDHILYMYESFLGILEPPLPADF